MSFFYLVILPVIVNAPEPVPVLAYSQAVKDATDSTAAEPVLPPAETRADPHACAASPGHFDELHGRVERRAAPRTAQEPSITINFEATNEDYTRAWSLFFGNLEADGLGDLNQRAASLARQIRDNGVTYNVYADEGGPQRPWSLDLFPLVLTPESWQQIEAGVTQRVRVLDHVMADV